MFQMMLFAKILKLKFISKTLFHNMRHALHVPAVDKAWEQHKADLITKNGDKAVCLLGTLSLLIPTSSQ